MKINLCCSEGEATDQPNDVLLAHMAGLMESEEAIGRANSSGLHQLERSTGESFENNGFHGFSSEMIAGQPHRGQQRLTRQPDAPNPILGGQFDHDSCNRRVHMEVQMAIQMIQTTNQFEMRFDLGAHLVAQATVNAPIKKVLQPGKHRLIRKTAAMVNDAMKAVRSKNARTAAHHQMQADVQIPMLSGKRRSLVARRTSHHQARRRKYTIAKATNHCRIDFARKAEIVGSDYQRPHWLIVSPRIDFRTRGCEVTNMNVDEGHWSRIASEWLAWARTPNHDAFWAYRASLVAFIGRGEGEAIEVGCGEGRVSRVLKDCGYRVTATDPVEALVSAAERARSADKYKVAPAAALPFAVETFDLAIAYNVLMDIEDVPMALRELRRVLRSTGTLVISIVHPFADRGRFAGPEADAAFVVQDSYFGRKRFEMVAERNGLQMHFAGWSQPLEHYMAALEGAGFAISALREPIPAVTAAFTHLEQWTRIPLFLWLKARPLPL
jgi:SAM-dependent methyltransferase